MAYPKFILTDSGEFRMGMVDMHRDLLQEGEDCYGGGFYEFDYTRGRLLLSGRSYDYGRPLWNLFDEIRLPEAYSGLTIIYWHIVINLCLGIEIAESEDEKFFICDSM